MKNLFSLKRIAYIRFVTSLIVTTLWLAFVFLGSASAQVETKELDLPECDVFLFELESAGESGSPIKLANGTNITNRPGYDNQPWFTPDSKTILFTANKARDRTDIFEYIVESKEIRRVTDSPTQEYSPQISPDNTTVSFVTDGETANQSIWCVQRGEDSAVIPNTNKWLLKHLGEREPVGYYSWNHKTGYILFWSRYGYGMKLTHDTKKTTRFVSGHAPPSTPYIIPGTDKFSFMHRQANEEVWIKELDPKTLAIRPLTKTIGANPNYGWTPDGWILMCDGTKLYGCLPADDATKNKWELVADLETMGMSSASRVAVSPDGKMIAIVGLPSDKKK